MQPQGSPSTNQLATTMVASGPQDEKAGALVHAIRQAGLRVVFAETANIAARASEAAACIAVLRPDTWKTPAIATVMRTKPDCLIPVLAESMALPRGPWTHPAISIANDPAQGEQELIQVLRDYLATHPVPNPTPSQNPDILTVNTILASRKRRRRLNIPLSITTILILIMLGLGGLISYRYYTTHIGKNTTAATGSIPTTVSHVVYTAHTPGYQCDTGGGQWEQADRYKKNRKIEVYDPYISSQCQSNGLLVMRSGAYDVYSEVFFDGIGLSPSIAQHSFAQVNATFISGDVQESITIDTHVHGYGRYSFDVNTLGHWEANTGDTVDGSSINRLAIGFFPKASRTYTLALETNGPVMSFWIDGIKVATVTDMTYSDNDAIAFGVSDWSAHKPISALFSNFKYEELPPSTLATPEVVATATAQAQSSAQTPYTAHIPGYDCDKGAGQWQPLADVNSPGTIHCLSNGTQLTSPANAKAITEENFYWLDGHFPANYKVSVQVNVSEASDGCTGLATRKDTNGDSYAFVICPNGSWEIDLLTNKFHILAQGWTGAQSTYTITAKSNGPAQSLYISGQLIKTVYDSHLKSTDHLGLYTGLYQSSQSQSVIFSNFVFTPLA